MGISSSKMSRKLFLVSSSIHHGMGLYIYDSSSSLADLFSEPLTDNSERKLYWSSVSSRFSVKSTCRRNLFHLRGNTFLIILLITVVHSLLLLRLSTLTASLLNWLLRLLGRLVFRNLLRLGRWLLLGRVLGAGARVDGGLVRRELQSVYQVLEYNIKASEVFKMFSIPAILLFPYPRACGRKSYILWCAQKLNWDGRADPARLSANEFGVVLARSLSVVSPL